MQGEQPVSTDSLKIQIPVAPRDRGQNAASDICHLPSSRRRPETVERFRMTAAPVIRKFKSVLSGGTALAVSSSEILVT